VKAVFQYRQYVDDAMQILLNDSPHLTGITELVTLGINHEQQHQELLWTDIKYILGHNPLFPAYSKQHPLVAMHPNDTGTLLGFNEGVYEIGFKGEGFSWDNEHGVHKVYLNAYEISTSLVTNGEYLEFINSGGYQDFRYWHSDGWAWVKKQKAVAPLYWHLMNGKWFNYIFRGLEAVDYNIPVCHVNYYEAFAYANWKGLRLPTEFEWEVAASKLGWGQRWEWTESAYLPYPGFQKAAGALGEYNGKFMVNQQVLRGASEVTPQGHSRSTYRNFFQTNLQWQFTGIRLAR
jgi:ergothioneine biosynthesis protein EgtB